MNVHGFSLSDHLRNAITRCHDARSVSGVAARLGLSRRSAGQSDEPAWARYSLPYWVHPMPGDRAIVLNRDYKPAGLGIPYGWWVDYEEFPQWIVPGSVIAAAHARGCNGGNERPASEGVQMFHDGCAPWRSAADLTAYLARLVVLADTIGPTPADSDPWLTLGASSPAFVPMTRRLTP